MLIPSSGCGASCDARGDALEEPNGEDGKVQVSGRGNCIKRLPGDVMDGAAGRPHGGASSRRHSTKPAQCWFTRVRFARNCLNYRGSSVAEQLIRK